MQVVMYDRCENEMLRLTPKSLNKIFGSFLILSFLMFVGQIVPYTHIVRYEVTDTVSEVRDSYGSYLSYLLSFDPTHRVQKTASGLTAEGPIVKGTPNGVWRWTFPGGSQTQLVTDGKPKKFASSRELNALRFTYNHEVAHQDFIIPDGFKLSNKKLIRTSSPP